MDFISAIKEWVSLQMRLPQSKFLSDRDGHGNTALHWSSFKNLPVQTRLLLGSGLSANVLSQPSGWTPLHDSAYSDSSNTMSLLLSSGALVDARASSGATPLCFSAQEDSPATCEMLIRWGASTSMRCEGGEGRFSGYTPLHYCAHYNAHRSCRVLISMGAPIDAKDLTGRMPIHIAVARGSEMVLKELLKAGAAVDAGNNEDQAKANEAQAPTSPQQQQQQQQQHTDPSLNPAIVTPDNSPLPQPPSTAAMQSLTLPPPTPDIASLTRLVPPRPILSSKPWNCISQRQIDSCSSIIKSATSGWHPKTHEYFTPNDRLGIVEILKVGKRFEQRRGVYLDMWPLVLSYCGRGWFSQSPPSSPSRPALSTSDVAIKASQKPSEATPAKAISPISSPATARDASAATTADVSTERSTFWLTPPSSTSASTSASGVSSSRACEGAKTTSISIRGVGHGAQRGAISSTASNPNSAGGISVPLPPPPPPPCGVLTSFVDGDNDFAMRQDDADGFNDGNGDEDDVLSPKRKIRR